MKKVVYISALAALIFHVDHLLAQAPGADLRESGTQVVRSETALRFSESIHENELKEHLTYLASDAFEGRETGQAGQKKAAQFLADYYAGLGIAPVVNGSWFQQYPLKKENFSASYAVAGNTRYSFIKDFYAFSPDWNTMKGEQVVFAGYGIREGRYNDYAGLDVKGKIVICLNGEPKDSKGRSRITRSTSLSEWSDDWGLKANLAKEQGAAGLLVVNMQYDQYMNRVRYWLEQSPMRLDTGVESEMESLPLAFISPALANKIFESTGFTVEDAQARMIKKKKPVHKETAIKLEFHMEPEVERISGENVLCFIEGSDPVLKNEIVVISAHYDHIGIVNGEINNGADDDGSGTVSVMEIAEAFIEAKKAGHGPRRSILILHVSGEEKGLLGSEWYSSNPVFPLENTVCDLNVDMIGRKDVQHSDDRYVYLIGSDKLSTDLHKISENCNATYTGLQLDYTYNDPKDPNRFYYRSDHYNFAKHGIPVIFYFSGVHEDYHRPGDDPEKILYPKMETIARLIFFTAWEVANRDEKLRVDVTNSFGR